MTTLDAGKVNSSGSFLRTAVVLSVVLQKPIHIINFGLERKFQGLSADHVALLHLLTSATSAVATDIEIGSTSFSFAPSHPWSPKKIALGVQGSISLALQGLLIPALFSRKQIKFFLTGKTHGKGAPTMHYVQQVPFKYVHPLLESISCAILSFGFRSQGAVEIVLEGKVNRLPPIKVLGSEELAGVKAELIASQDFLSHEVLFYIERVLSIAFPQAKITAQYVKADVPSIAIGLFAFYGDAYGFDNDKPFVLGKDATWTFSSAASFDKDLFTKELLSTIDAFKKQIASPAVDEFCADQLIPLLALLGGVIRVEKITDATKANMFVAEQLAGTQFDVQGTTIVATPRLEDL